MPINENVAVSAPLPIAHERIGAGLRQWVHILPANPIETRDGRGPYFVDDPQAVMRETQKRKGKAKLLVDYDHQSETVQANAARAEAAGWISGLQSRDSGIWAFVEWTEKAAAHIAAKEYRYLSPAFIHDHAGRISHIISVGLVNSPNLHELTALSKEDRNAMAKTPVHSEPTVKDPAPRSDSTDFTQEEMQQIRQLLKLEPGSPPELVLEMLKKLVGQLAGAEQQSANAAIPDPSKYVPIGEFERAVAEANALRKGIDKSAAVHHVEAQIKAGHLAPAFRSWGIDLCVANKQAFDSFIEKTGPAFQPLFKQVVLPGEPQPRAGSVASDSEQEICDRLNLTTEEFNAAR